MFGSKNIEAIAQYVYLFCLQNERYRLSKQKKQTPIHNQCEFRIFAPTRGARIGKKLCILINCNNKIYE